MVDQNATTGERMINVPGRGQVPESQFRQMVQNNELAGGPSGSAMTNAINTGTYTDPYAGGGSSSPATPSSSGSSSTASGSSGGSAATQAANSAFGQNMGGVPPDARNENVYALRNNDDPTSWAKRVFAQGTADSGAKALNPYLDQNPLANSPFAQWYQSRYGTSAPTNALVGDEISGQAPTAANMQVQMGSGPLGAQGGNSGPRTAGEAQSNLGQLNSMVNNTGGDGQNATQRMFAGQLRNDPQLASQIVTSQMQGGTGGWGMGFLGNELSNLATHYYNDPASQGPQSANGTFLNQAMKMMGMA